VRVRFRRERTGGRSSGRATQSTGSRRLASLEEHMSEIEWSRYPLTAENNLGRRWLQIQRDLGLAQNILEAYGRGFEEYLGFLRDANVEPTEAGGEVIARYVQRLRARPGAVRGNVTQIDSHSTLSNAALQQRLTIIRLFNDFILEERLCVRTLPASFPVQPLRRVEAFPAG